MLYLGQEKNTTVRKDNEAIRELEHCITVDPNHQECRKVLEMAQTDNEEKRQKHIEACYSEGKRFLKKKDYSQATHYFREVLKLAPDHGDAERQLELAKESTKRQQEIEKYYSQGLQSIDSGNYSRAVSYFEKVLRFDTEFREAKEHLETAKQKEKAMAEYLSSGMVSFNGGDYSEAILDFNHVLKLNPNDGEAKRYLEIAKVKKMEEKLEEKKLDILVDTQGDAKLPEGW